MASIFANIKTVTHPNPLQCAFQSIPSNQIPSDLNLKFDCEIPELDFKGIRTISINPFSECTTFSLEE